MPKIMSRVTSRVMFRMFWLVASMALWFRSWIFSSSRLIVCPLGTTSRSYTCRWFSGLSRALMVSTAFRKAW